ncbi:MAG: PorP/SprF family type IX secretion system membrane protein [Bacteroidota bacterium]
MKRFLTSLSVCALLGLGYSGNAQDVHFSQFYENAILRNPSLTGIFTGDYKIGVDYRTQWGTVATPYNTIMISGETRVLVNRELGDYLSFGLVTTYDKAGAINFSSTQIYPAISYNKSLEDAHNSYLSVGFTGGYLSRSVDMSKMTFTSQYIGGTFSANNPSGENNTYKSLNNYDLGAGVSLNSSLDDNGIFNYYLGASVFHINRATELFSGSDVLVKLPMKWQFSGGFHCSFNQSFGLTAHANYSRMYPYTNLIFGGLLTWRSVPVGLPSVFAIHFGAFYRNKDAIIPTIKIDYQDISFGFSQDVTTSSLATGAQGAGATEISLYLRGMYAHRKNPRDPLMCPRFEDINNYSFR